MPDPALMNVYFEVLGCRLNEAETESWARDFHRRGFQISKCADSADIVVVNSCAVTREAMRKSRQLIRRCQQRNPHAKLVVSGCYASLAANEVAALAGVDLVVPNSEKAQLPLLTLKHLSVDTMPILATEPGEYPLFARGRSRAFVKVQDGCRYRCAFCIVTTARGSERSQPIGTVVDEINALVAAGIKDVVLTGVHLGGYGSDLNKSLHQLITAVLCDTDVQRLRLGSLEPWDLPDDFFSLYANPRLMPHLHLPLQSGSDTVLRRMGRRCNTSAYRRLVTTAREIADFNITSDIIVGFPGETADEWQQSRDYIESIGFSHLHIFAYSAQPGTRAAEMSDQLTASEKKRRAAELRVIANRMKRNFLQALVGRRTTVLWETGLESDKGTGYTPNFARVTGAHTPGCQRNEITTADIIGVTSSGDRLIAEVPQSER